MMFPGRENMRVLRVIAIELALAEQRYLPECFQLFSLHGIQYATEVLWVTIFVTVVLNIWRNHQIYLLKKAHMLNYEGMHA